MIWVFVEWVHFSLLTSLKTLLKFNVLSLPFFFPFCSRDFGLCFQSKNCQLHEQLLTVLYGFVAWWASKKFPFFVAASFADVIGFFPKSRIVFFVSKNVQHVNLLLLQGLKYGTFFTFHFHFCICFAGDSRCTTLFCWMFLRFSLKTFKRTWNTILKSKHCTEFVILILNRSPLQVSHHHKRSHTLHCLLLFWDRKLPALCGWVGGSWMPDVGRPEVQTLKPLATNLETPLFVGCTAPCIPTGPQKLPH